MKTYIDYILAFWRRQKEDALSCNEAFLYLYLLHFCNNIRFKNPFPLTLEHLCNATHQTKHTVLKTRKVLKDKSYIDFQEGLRGRTNTNLYTLVDVPISTDENGAKITPINKPEKVQKMHQLKGAKNAPKNQEKVHEKVQKIHQSSDFTPIIDIYKDNRQDYIYNNSAGVTIENEDKINPSEQLIKVKDGILQAVIRQQHQSWVETFCMNNHITVQAFGVNFDIWCKHVMDQGATEYTISEAKKHFANWYKLQIRVKQNGANRTTYNKAEQRKLQAEQRNQQRAQRILAACGLSGEGNPDTQIQVSKSNTYDAGIPPETGEYPFD